jgi:hypothetical protein
MNKKGVAIVSSKSAASFGARFEGLKANQTISDLDMNPSFDNATSLIDSFTNLISDESVVYTSVNAVPETP